MSNSNNQVALITGGGSGFGRVTAVKLVAAGWQVVAAFRGHRLGFDATATTLAGHGIATVELDVTDTDSVARGVADVVARFGRIDAVVNGAGYGPLGPMENTPCGETRRLYDTKVFGTMRVCQTVVPVMRAQGSGRIVNLGSDVGCRANYFQSSYAASKFAVDGFSQSLRLEMRRFGVSVSLVSPGWYDTEFGESVVTTFESGDTAPLYARVISDWDTGVGAVVGPNDNPEEVADLLVSVLTAPTPRYWCAIGWNATRMGALDLDDIDSFQTRLVDDYRMDGRPAPDSGARG